MTEKPVGIRVMTVVGTTEPGAVQNLRLSPNKVPNPDTTSFRVMFDAAAVPSGAPALAYYKAYRDGVHERTLTLAQMEPGWGAPAYPIQVDTDYVIGISAVNLADEEGPVTYLTVHTLSVTGSKPAAPSSLTSPAKTNTTVDLSWTASATAGVVYDAYVDDATTSAVVGATGTTATVTGLVAGTTYSFLVKARNAAGVSSNASNILSVTTNGTLAAVVLRSDNVLDANQFNVKASYTNGTHGAAPANVTKVIDLAVSMGMRGYRQEPVSGGAASTQQFNFIKAIYDAWGGKFHATMGHMRKAGGFDVPNMSDEVMRIHAAYEIKWQLDRLKEMNDDASLNNGGAIENWLDCLAGPNEVETQPDTGSNWPRNARTWQQQLWEGARNGKFWNGTYTKAKNAQGIWVYTVTSAGTGFVSQRTAFPALFANVNIFAPSTRSDLDASTAKRQIPVTLAGPVINTGTGARQISQWCNGGNCHLYQVGQNPTQRVTTFIDLCAPTAPAPGYPTTPYNFSETGYNNMGFAQDGTDVATSSSAGNSLDGAVKCPPWVSATFAVKAIAHFASMGIPYVRHEFLNDAYKDGSGNYLPWEIQSWFGIIDTPRIDPTTWVPNADYYAIRRMMQIMYDRVSAHTRPTFSVAGTPPFTVTTANGCRVLRTKKANGDWYVLVWRDLDFWIDNLQGTAGRVAYSSGGVETPGLPPKVNFTMQLTHSSGNKTVGRFQPNKAIWEHEAVTSPTSTQLKSTKSTGHGDTTQWTGTPTADQSFTVAPSGSFTISVGVNLQIIKIPA